MWQLSGIAVILLAGGSAPPANNDHFQSAAAVLSTHCVRCHNADKTRGGLDISTRDAAFQGGATSDALVPREPAKSALFERAESGSMPPEKDGRRLNAEEVAALRKWIEVGAPWPENITLPLPKPQLPMTTPLASPPPMAATNGRSSRPNRLRYRRVPWR